MSDQRDKDDVPAMDEIDIDLTDTEVHPEGHEPDVGDDLAQATQAAAQSVSEPPTETEEEDDLWSEFAGGNKHVTLDNPVYKRQKIDPTQPALSALKLGIKELEEVLIRRDLVDLDEEKVKSLSKEDQRVVNVTRGLISVWQDLYFDNIDKDGDWHQNVLHGEARLGPGKVRPENLKDPVLSIRASFGQGSVVQVPLWNTGLWVTLRSPTLTELSDFEFAARSEKMNLGRSSNGMVFSNTEVYTVETYVRFVLEHVVAINYKFETSDSVNELMGVIRNRDYQQLILGQVMAMYPDGYAFRQPCVAETDTCNHIDEMVLNFARMGMVDRSKFTDKQKLMMASRKTKRDRDWLQEYQSEFTFFEKRVKLNESFTAVLKVPSLEEQIHAGHIWADGIVQSTESAFGHKLSEMERVRHVMRSGALTNLRQYSHWIAQFEHSTDPDTQPRIVDEIEMRDRILDMLSEDPVISSKLTEEIIDWIRKSTVSYVGLPKINCPACQQEPADESHPYLIPLDIGYIFFTLAAFKISLVEDAAQ